MQAALKIFAGAGRDLDAVLTGEDAVEHVVGAACGQLNRLSILMLIEDPGAANFAAGLLPVLHQHGVTTLLASGAGAEQLTRLNVASEAIVQPFQALDLIADMQPDLVVVGTSENRDADAHVLVAACRKQGIPSLGFIDGPANINHRFQGSSDTSLAFAPDWVLVPGQRLREALKQAGFPADHAIAIEHPHFSHLEEERKRLEATGRKALRERLFPDVQEGRTIVIFLAERSGGLDPAGFRRSGDYTLQGRGGDDRRTNIVLEEVLDALREFNPRPYVVLRLHPKNNRDEYAAYAGEIDMLSQNEPALDMVYAADAVVGLTTILLSEAAMLRRPVLSVVPREEEKSWLLDPPEGHITCVSRRADIVQLLQEVISHQ